MKKNVALSIRTPTHTHAGTRHATQLTDLGFKTFLFDFDLTLVNQHCYKNDIAPQEVETMSNSLFQTYFNDPAYLTDFLYTLTTHPDAYVAIVSFGREDVIRAFLARLLDKEDILHSQQIHIYTPLSQGLSSYSSMYRVPENKNDFIGAIMLEHAESATLLIDNDARMLTAAKSAFPDIHTLHVSASSGQAGLTAAHMETFLAEPHVVIVKQPGLDALSTPNTGMSTPPSSSSTSYSGLFSTPRNNIPSGSSDNSVPPDFRFPEFTKADTEQDPKRFKFTE